eukprot:3632085-Prorocentrum_lima.AAC.1
MTSSLVGSEMCIRDSSSPAHKSAFGITPPDTPGTPPTGRATSSSFNPNTSVYPPLPINDTPFDNLGSTTPEQQIYYTSPLVMRSEEEVASHFGGPDATTQGKY